MGPAPHGTYRPLQRDLPSAASGRLSFCPAGRRKLGYFMSAPPWRVHPGPMVRADRFKRSGCRFAPAPMAGAGARSVRPPDRAILKTPAMRPRDGRPSIKTPQQVPDKNGLNTAVFVHPEREHRKLLTLALLEVEILKRLRGHLAAVAGLSDICCDIRCWNSHVI